jgi:hypothetical protein
MMNTPRHSSIVATIIDMSSFKTPEKNHPVVSEDVINIGREIPMSVFVDCPHATADSRQWREAMKNLRGRFDMDLLQWEIVVDPMTIGANIAEDLIRVLSKHKVIASIMPHHASPKLANFAYFPKEWVNPVVCLSTSFEDKETLKSICPAAHWDNFNRMWYVPYANTSGGVARLIDEHGWFTGVVERNSTTIPEMHKMVSCTTMPHSRCGPATACYSLFSEKAKCSMVMSIHPYKHLSGTAGAMNVIYISRLLHTKSDISFQTKPVRMGYTQNSTAHARTIWNTLVKCGFTVQSTDQRIRDHVERHTRTVADLHSNIVPTAV